MKKNKIQKYWTESDIAFLTENYGKLKTKEIATVLGRTYQSVKSMATKRLKLVFGNRHQNLLLPLFEDTINNWYWYGFITGDGNFAKNSVNITIHKDDINHLSKLSVLFNSNLRVNGNYVTMNVGDGNNYVRLKDKLGIINECKTINPVILPSRRDDLFFSYFIGLVDSDGCIEIRNGKAAQLKIELHGTWYDNLVKISEFLNDYLTVPCKVLVNNRGYSLLRISGHKNILKIKNKAESLKIDYLDRKWVRISDSIIGCNFFHEIKPIVISLYKEGYNLHKISKMLNVNYTSLYNYKDAIANS
jgi:hypothetical protein